MTAGPFVIRSDIVNANFIPGNTVTTYTRYIRLACLFVLFTVLVYMVTGLNDRDSLFWNCTTRKLTVIHLSNRALQTLPENELLFCFNVCWICITQRTSPTSLSDPFRTRPFYAFSNNALRPLGQFQVTVADECRDVDALLNTALSVKLRDAQKTR